MRTRLGVSKGLELANGLVGAIREFSVRQESAAKEQRTKSFTMDTLWATTVIKIYVVINYFRLEVVRKAR